MKQLLQNLRTGKTEVAEVPTPLVKPGQILIATSSTLISVGTEKMLVEFAKAGWINKIRQQPDKVRMVLDKIKTDGLISTLEIILNKLDQPMQLGYCNVGRIIKLGAGVQGFNVGDRVVSNGKHAEVISIPANLCVKIPDNVSDDDASFTVLGAIALQGIRLISPSLGETVVVTGLGLVGLLAVQLLRAQGCRVLALDYDRQRLDLAQKFGAEVVDLSAGQDPIETANVYSRGRGVDAVLITAATQSSEPIHQAALMCRQRGRIVLVGVTGLELSRDDFYKKELTFQVSSSYGAGRYDPNYEDKGQDYPFGLVRWTAKRNFEAVLDMIVDGRLNLKPLVTHRFIIDDAPMAYELIGSGESSLGILLGYSYAESTPKVQSTVDLNRQSIAKHEVNKIPNSAIGVIGAGNYATTILIPCFMRAGASLQNVVSSSGITGMHAARKFGFCKTTTDTQSLFSDDRIDSVVIATRHDSHARYVLSSLRSMKHCFVEKPLCLTTSELNEIESTYLEIHKSKISLPILMVGFNRRFSPQIKKIKQLLGNVIGLKTFIMTVNAGFIPPDHWVHDRDIGGGRIIGEACHFIDLLRFLAGVPIASWQVIPMQDGVGDSATIQLIFLDGSIGTIHYFSNGSKLFPKERLEVFCAGKVLQLDNYRKLRGLGWPRFKKFNLWRQDKGQKACVQAYMDSTLSKGAAPIPFNEIIEVTRASISIADAIRGN